MTGLCSHSPDAGGLAGDLASPLHRLDPRAKLIGLAGASVVAVTTPIRAWPVLAGCALGLSAYATIARVPPRVLWRRGRVALPLILIVAVLIPLVREGGSAWVLGPLTIHEAGLVVAASVAAKTALGLTSAVLLGATTTVPSLLGGLERLRVPRLFVLIAAFMYRYLFVIADEVRRMRSALAARGYRPRTALHAAAAGRVAGALFLRAYGRGERVYQAMLARGYRGRMPGAAAPLRLVRADLAFLAVAATLLPLRVAVELAA